MLELVEELRDQVTFSLGVEGDSAADLVTLARPFLADELFPTKAFHGNSELINTCIGCNQACLDHVFKGKTASCLVNPYACKEKKFDLSSHSRIISSSSKKKQRIAVIGAGPAGTSSSFFHKTCSRYTK